MKREIDAFLSYLSTEKGFSQNTIDAYRNDLYQLQAFIQGQGYKARGLADCQAARIERSA